MWRMLKGLRQDVPAEQSADKQITNQSVPLVNCGKCFRWVPENTAIRIGMKKYFCSKECFEKTAGAR